MTGITREQIRKYLIEIYVDQITCDPVGLVSDIVQFGFKGVDTMTDQELMEELQESYGSKSEFMDDFDYEHLRDLRDAVAATDEYRHYWSNR